MMITVRGGGVGMGFSAAFGMRLDWTGLGGPAWLDWGWDGMGWDGRVGFVAWGLACLVLYYTTKRAV